MNHHNSIQQQLNELANLYTKQEKLEADKVTQLDKALTKPVRDKIKGIEADFATKEETLSVKVRKLEVEIKQAVIDLGETVQGEELWAVWNKGRVSWDDAKLEGFCKIHPELKEFRSTGKPSVSIKKAK